MTEARGAAPTVPCLTLVTRQDCPLCEDFQTALVAWCDRQRSFSLRVVDVDDSVILQQLYGWSVPVLLDGEQLVCSGYFDADRLAAWSARSEL